MSSPYDWPLRATLMGGPYRGRESEYAAWTLVNGYALNHVALAVHSLQTELSDIRRLNTKLEAEGVELSGGLKGNCRLGRLQAGGMGRWEGGGELGRMSGGCVGRGSVSPDGGLLQSSTVADKVAFVFAGGEEGVVSAGYLEFAQRLVLPKFGHLAAQEISEHHRRDGFEVGNADKIFESTYSNSNNSV